MTLRACTNTHIVGSTILGMLIFTQTLCGKFSYCRDGPGFKSGDLTTTFFISWGWWLFCFLPLFIYFVKKGGRGHKAPKVDWVAYVAIFIYQLIPLATIFAEPFTYSFQRELLINSFFWMVPAVLITLTMIHTSVKHENAVIIDTV